MNAMMDLNRQTMAMFSCSKKSADMLAGRFKHQLEAKTIPASDAWCHLTDILRLQVFCKTPEEIKELFVEKILPQGEIMQILRFKPRFGTFLQDMIINFNWRGRCICELQIKLADDGGLSRGYFEQHFVYEVVRTLKAKSTGLLADCLLNRFNKLMETGAVAYDYAYEGQEAQPGSL